MTVRGNRPVDVGDAGRASMPDAFDVGLLTPVSAGRDAVVSDGAVLHAMVEAEVALMRAYADAVAQTAAPEADSAGAEQLRRAANAADVLHAVTIDPAQLALDAVAGGNPVIPLVKALRAGAPDDVKPWVHRGATSQDILDTALMLVARDAVEEMLAALDRTVAALRGFAARHRDVVAAGRTLTQHAVPTTIGLRAVNWLAGVERAAERLRALRLPAQLGGAGGTLAATVEFFRRNGRADDAAVSDECDPADADPGHPGRALLDGSYSAGHGAGADRDAIDVALAVRDAYARELRLGSLLAPWHSSRWPVTELGDALAQAVAALGKVATDVATASRTEIAELAEPTGGGSSAMPQKQNPARSVLIRSAAIRAPQLAATLHLAAGLAADERPDGAWHAEWPALRDLLRAALGASSQAADLVEGLRVNEAGVARNLGATGGLIVSERLSAVLGKDRAAEIVAGVAAGGDLAELVRGAGEDPAELLDPANYTGLAGEFVDRAADNENRSTG
ncbi:lyase family protein [Microbacterium halotolerans]|uniref:lyase family protein n=1 Tax=Microbacterium halotolerans TaxID=246613 RepID=UPI001F096FD6|nr:lyase family protein [Microbacterium halotolerans]